MGSREKNVFISYGHNVFDDVVKKMQIKLKEELKGFSFFFDKDFLYEGDWEEQIDNHIKASKWMIFFVSKRSVSRDGYCLNELCRACEKSLKIIPVILDGSEVPLSVNRLHRYDLTDGSGVINDACVEKVTSELIDIFSGKKEIPFADEDIVLRQTLNPIDFKKDISVHYDGFVGRDKVFEKVEEWLYSDDDDDNNIFLIKAFPGFGKTAFSANCCWKFQNEIGAIHFCKFNNSDKADSKHIITSIAYSLAQKLPDYRQSLKNVLQANDIASPSSPKNADRIFELLFVDAMDDLYFDNPCLVIIDALDEAIWQGQINNELCGILKNHKKKLPPWLKILVTCRDDNTILHSLQYVSNTLHITRDINDADIRKYFETELSRIDKDKVTDRAVNLLLEKSEGSFIYAREIIKYLKKYGVGLDEIEFLPTGLYELYTETFRRIFGTGGKVRFEDVVPLLEFICITPEEPTPAFVRDYLGWGERETNERLDALSSLIAVKEDKIEIVHKTLKDWLVSHELSGEYFVSETDGYERLRKYIKCAYETGNRFHPLCLKHYGMVLCELVKRVGGEKRAKYLNELMNILNDRDFQIKRIDNLTLDSGLKLYVSEINFVFENDKSKVNELYCDDTFAYVFSEYRRLLYNSGLFFLLKNSGFSDYLANNAGGFDLQGDVGKIFYYYITEDFALAIDAIDKTLKVYETELKEKDALKAEIYNVKGLALRKIVDFGRAQQAHDAAIECGRKCDYNFELSMAHLIKSKMDIRMGETEKCRSNGEETVRYMKRAIEKSSGGDERTANILFLAEDYRVLCDNMIWAGDLAAAVDYMNRSREIYIKYAATDRYYIRSQYTELLLKTVCGERGLDADIDRVEKAVSNGKYDVGQINIIKCLYLLLTGGDAQKAKAAAQKAYGIYDGIHCPLEREEARSLCDAACKRLGEQSGLTPYTENTYINNWITFYENYLKELVGRTKAK